VKRVVGLPIDRARVQCDQNAIAAFYDELEVVIEGIPAEFVYNINESGCNHWADQPVNDKLETDGPRDNNSQRTADAILSFGLRNRDYLPCERETAAVSGIAQKGLWPLLIDPPVTDSSDVFFLILLSACTKDRQKSWCDWRHRLPQC
jgi:hypothetical protein